MGNTIGSSNSSLAMPAVVTGGDVGNLAIVTPLPPYVDPVVENWATRVVVNGGAAPSGGTKAALSTFYTGMVSEGLLSKMIAVNCFVPDNLSASITPLINSASAGNDPWTNIGNRFIPSDLNVNGLTGNGTVSATAKALDTGIIPINAYADNTSAGLTIYNSSVSSTDSTEIGTRSSSNARLTLMANKGGTSSLYSWADTGTRIGITPLSNGSGFVSGNRTSAITASLYVASSTVPFQSIAGPGGSNQGTVPTSQIKVFCYESFGNNSNASNKTLSFAAIHRGLSAAECQTFYNLIQAMRQSLGGGYV